MNEMPAKSEFVLLAAINAGVWLVNVESVLKILFLLLSIGFLLHRWFHWSKNKNRRENTESGFDL